MGSESYHEPVELLSESAKELHRGIFSLVEELEAIDWYQQRADVCSDPELKKILLHNMEEEMEHGSMLLEWIRRNNSNFNRHLRSYLFSEGDITKAEESMKTSLTEEPGKAAGHNGSLGTGSLKGK